jgi:membrane protein required for colicin V production
MNWLDIVIIVILIGSLIGGIQNGLIKAALSLIGLVVGIVLAGRFYLSFSHVLSFIPHEGAAKIVAFVIILAAALIVFGIIAALLTKLASALLLGWINRLAGAVVGVIMGAIFMGAVLAIWVRFLGMTGAIAGSAIAPFLLKYFPVVLSLLPSEFDRVRSFFQ